MNKPLHWAMGLLICGSAFSASAEVKTEMIPDFQGRKLSSDGRYIGSSFYGMIEIRDMEQGKSYLYGDGNDEYGLGNGNAISNSGHCVGSVNDDAALFYNGEMTLFYPGEPLVDDKGFPIIDDFGQQVYGEQEYSMSYANATNPGFTRVVGEVVNKGGTDGMNGLILVPCYWDVTTDGKIGKIHFLPFPEKDFTDRVPTYVTAIQIADDGQTIFGQIYDYSGCVCEPIVYSQAADGSWSYSLPGRKLVNPKDLKFPPYPEDDLEMPSVTDFMSDEERAKYEAQLDIYWETFDPNDEPNPADYMTLQQIEDYNKQVDIYNAEAEKFDEALVAFYKVWDEWMQDAALFVFNSLVATPDGKKIAVSADKVNFETEESTSVPYIFDLANGTYKVYDKLDMIPTTLTNAGILLAVHATWDEPRTAYVITPNSNDAIPFEKWVADNNETYSEFMKENLVHSFVTQDYDPETGEIINTDNDNFMFTGSAYSTPDMNTFIGSVDSYLWNPIDDDIDPGITPFAAAADGEEGEDEEGDDDSDLYPEYTTYYMAGGELLAVKSVNWNSFGIKALHGGNLEVSGKADVYVYDLTGKLVYTARNASGILTTGLRGTYIVKAVDGNATRSLKVAF